MKIIMQKQRTVKMRVCAFFLAFTMILSGSSIPVNAASNTEQAVPTVISGWNYTEQQEGMQLTKENPAAATTGAGSLYVEGAAYISYTSKSLSASGWNDGSWVIENVNATDYSNLTFSASLRSSGTGPRDFQLEYSLDNGAAWNTVEGSQTAVTTTLAECYKGYALPEILNGKNFMLRVHMTGNTSVNGGTVGANGTSNINNISITGVKTQGDIQLPEEGEKELICESVIANPGEGEVSKGTEITLACQTEDADIFYKTGEETDYVKYDAPIQINEDTVIKAYASKAGYTDSAETTFTYTVPEEAVPEPAYGNKLTAVEDGATFIVYNPAAKKVMGQTASGTRLAGVDGTVSEEGILDAPEGAAILKAEKDADTGYYTFSCNGKYLTTGATGGNLTLEPQASDYSLWELQEENGAFLIHSVNAAYNSTANQYIEYYSTFTVYGKRDTSAADPFAMELYGVKPSTDFVVDDSIVLDVAQWAGNANYQEAGVAESKVVYGDLYKTNDMQDTEAEYTAVVNGTAIQPYKEATATGTGSTSYYLGGDGIGSGNNDYVQMKLSSEGYAAMNLSFRLRTSNTGAGSFQLQYSTDAKDFKNFTNGTYSYKDTAYNGSGESYEKSDSGVITDGIAKTSMLPGKYIDFTFELPAGAENAKELYIRLVPGEKNAKGDSTPGTKGALRIDSVKLTGSPVIADDICGYVTINPKEGEVSTGSEITLTTATKDAEIYYSVNNGDYQKYDETSKPVISELPMTIRAYASKEGLKDSVKRIFQYKNGKVNSVKASPNGGAVLPGTEVTLSCTTEGATIYYSTDQEEWTEYTDTIKLTTLPATYYVKAEKDGYETSSITTLNYTERTSEKYNLYFGQLHAHTSYSDGAGTAEDAYQHATAVENLDFLAVTDHSNSFDNDTQATITDGSMSTEWTEGHQLADKYTNDKFVSIFGYEMTWSNGLGHVNTFNTNGFQSRTQSAYTTYSTALQNYYETLKTVPDSMTQFNHPGTTFGDFSDFSYYDPQIDNLITMIEVGNGEGAIGSSGYFPSYEYYQRALDKGWHVAPTNNQDNHKGLWGDANTARSVVMTDSLTRDSIYDAMRNYRVYATEDNDLSIYYTLDGYEMGSVLSADQTGDTVKIKAELSDPTDGTIGKVQVITNGGLVLKEQQVDAAQDTVEFDVDNQYSYYYLKITEKDGDIAVTAPVWVGEVEAAGINGISTDEVLPVRNQPLNVNLDLYNNEAGAMKINSITFNVGGETVHTADLASAGLTEIASMGTGNYTFSYTYDGVGSMEIEAVVNAELNGSAKVYKSVLKLNYVTPDMVTKVVIDGSHYNDYVTGYYGANVGNFTTIAGKKNIRVEIVKNEADMAEALKDCALLIVSAPAKKNSTANAGAYTVSHFSDEFINTVKTYTDNGGSMIACGIADYQDSADGQTTTEINKLLGAIGATTTLNSDEAYDEQNNGGQPYRLYLKNTYKKDSPYLAGATEEQEYSAYSGCTVNLNADAVANGKAEALVSGYDTTYSIDSKGEGGTRGDNSVVVEKGNVVALGHETLGSGANLFVAGTVFISDFEVKAEVDNQFDLQYLNYTIINNILDEVTVRLAATPISEVRKAAMGEVFAIEGYVTAGTSNEYNKFFDAINVQDDTAGITVFPYAALGLELGTKVRITGYVDEYQGEKELQVMSSEILFDEPSKVIEPEKMSAKEAMDYEQSGGKLVRVEGEVTDVKVADDGKGVSQFWIKDENGDIANIFIDGYIFSGTTGKNELASVVKKGEKISAAGLVYSHPATGSDENEIVLRVRNCDEIYAVSDADSVDKSGLQTVITNAQNKVQKDYTEESWARLQQALEAAVLVMADANATQEEVDAATSALNTAIEELVRVNTGDDAENGGQNPGSGSDNPGSGNGAQNPGSGNDNPDEGNGNQNPGSGTPNAGGNAQSTGANGQKATSAVQQQSAAKTGDQTNVAGYAAALLLAAVAATAAITKETKRKKRRS